MKWLIAVAVVAMIVAHQDFWLWNDRTLVFGFVPIGLLYHGLFSLTASLLMVVLVRHAWPSELEQIEAEEKKSTAAGDPS